MAAAEQGAVEVGERTDGLAGNQHAGCRSAVLAYESLDGLTVRATEVECMPEQENRRSDRFAVRMRSHVAKKVGNGHVEALGLEPYAPVHPSGPPCLDVHTILGGYY